jgi:subtilisin family serine protease
VRVLDNNGFGTTFDVAQGITYAADHGAKVINLSLGGGSASTLRDAVNYAWNKGVFLACAAGNDGTSSTSDNYPAAYPNCFAVAATDSSDRKASWSTYGSWVEAAAPGVSIYSTYRGSGYATVSGTSMSTPHVSGLAGLLASQGLTNVAIRDRICSTADRIGGTGSSWTCGRINAARAVGTPSPTPPPPAPTPPPPSPTPPPPAPTPPPPSPTPPPPSPTPPPDVIVNGGFESGTSPWVQSAANGEPLITTTRPHSGSRSAWLAGYNSANDKLYQSVTVPANGTLTYWWYMTTSESGSTVYDQMRVALYDTGGTLVATLRTYSNASAKGSWRQDSVSLASYAARTLRVQFTATTDSSLSTSFFVDDVSLR